MEKKVVKFGLATGSSFYDKNCHFSLFVCDFNMEHKLEILLFCHYYAVHSFIQNILKIHVALDYSHTGKFLNCLFEVGRVCHTSDLNKTLNSIATVEQYEFTMCFESCYQ